MRAAAPVIRASARQARGFATSKPRLTAGADLTGEAFKAERAKVAAHAGMSHLAPPSSSRPIIADRFLGLGAGHSADTWRKVTYYVCLPLSVSLCRFTRSFGTLLMAPLPLPSFSHPMQSPSTASRSTEKSKHTRHTSSTSKRRTAVKCPNARSTATRTSAARPSPGALSPSSSRRRSQFLPFPSNKPRPSLTFDPSSYSIPAADDV